MTQPSPRRPRRPRYGRFLVTGALLGVVAAFAVSSGSGDPGRYSREQVFFYLVMVFALIGGLLAGALAVALDGGFRRTAKARRAAGDRQGETTP